MSIKIAVRKAKTQDIPALNAMAIKLGKVQEPGYFDHCLELQEQGKREMLIISEENGALAGYGILNWQPKYALFKRLGIPEIQDLNILPDHRRKGLASAFIAICENKAREKGIEDMGIAFGVHSKFGPAQSLYIKLGYIPDGQGVTYDRQQIAFADFKPVDDDLCLMLVKSL